jgi:nucleoside-diphosphate-sugar epimerase
VIMGLEAERSQVAGEIFNLGTDDGNYSKDDIVRLILKRMPETVVEYKNLTFGGDMRDITVSFAKIRNVLGFETKLTVDDGIREVLFALKTGIIRNPTDEKYRNAQFIVQ